MNGSVPLSFHFHVEVMPEIPDLEYKGLEAVRRVRAVQDEEVEQVIEERLKSEAALVPIEDRKAETGDTIITDLSGVFLNEPSAEPIKADNIEITLGDERVEKAFTDNLLGVASEEVKSFRVDYPAEFTSPGLAGKSVEYTATIKTVGKIETPKADDEWAKSLEENFSGMKELRRKLRDDMEFIAKLEADNKVRDALVNALIDKNELEAPASLVDSQARNLANNFAQNMMQQGLDPKQAQQDFWQMVLQQMLPQAEREVRGALLLEKVGELEKVEATEEEINTEIENMANSARVTVQQVKQYLAGQGGEASIADRIRNRKSVEALFEHAKITDGEWIDEAAQAAEAAAAAGETGAAEEAKPEEKKPAKKTTAKPKAKKKEAE
jgi:trigger factor